MERSIHQAISPSDLDIVINTEYSHFRAMSLPHSISEFVNNT